LKIQDPAKPPSFAPQRFQWFATNVRSLPVSLGEGFLSFRWLNALREARVSP
jgi:hypothetical protein